MRGSLVLKYKEFPDIVKVGILAFLLVTVSFLLQGNIGLNLADEGYLWYGAEHTKLGEVPIRDFQSYDPGRYYWVSLWYMMLGNGIIALRIATGIFQIIGLTFGLLVLRRVIQPWWMLVLSGILLLVWMYPRHKLFEPSIAMAALYFAVLLIEKPSIRRHFIAGVFVGLAAFFGRNHGLYGFIAFFGLILFIWLKINRTDFIRRFIAWGSGILLGYSPMLIMFFFVPNLFEKWFIEKIAILFRIKSTNLTIPVPWPWNFNYSNLDLMQFASSISVGLFFVMLLLVYSIFGLYLILSRPNSFQKKELLIAVAFVGPMYAHYAFSRADLGHLALGIHPLLIGLLALPFIIKLKKQRVLTISLICLVYIMSFFSVVKASPYYMKANSPKESYVSVNISGDNLWLDQEMANLIDVVRKINKQKVQPGEELLIAPHWPTFYPILHRKSPLWPIYFIYPEVEDKQKEMIIELKQKNVNWVLLGDIPLDGRDDLRFRNTHKLIWRYLMDNFEPVKVEGLPSNQQLLHRK